MSEMLFTTHRRASWKDMRFLLIAAAIPVPMHEGVAYKHRP